MKVNFKLLLNIKWIKYTALLLLLLGVLGYSLSVNQQWQNEANDKQNQLAQVQSEQSVLNKQLDMFIQDYSGLELLKSTRAEKAILDEQLNKLQQKVNEKTQIINELKQQLKSKYNL